MTHPLKNKLVAFTGRLSKVRRQCRKDLEDVGGYFSGSVSARIDILIAGPGAGSKLIDAKRMGIEIWDEDDFNAALKGKKVKKKKKRNRKYSRSRSRSYSPRGGLNQKRDRKKICKYGKQCFRTSREHLAEFSHPATKKAGELSSDEYSDDANRNDDEKKEIEGNVTPGGEVLSDLALYSDDDDDDNIERRNLLQNIWQKTMDVLSAMDIQCIPKDFCDKIKNKRIVLTGWFPISCKSDLVSLIVRCGGHVSNEVTKDTQLLIIGERPGIKLFQALQMELSILAYTDIAELLQMSGK